MNKTIYKDINDNDNRLNTMRARGCKPMGSRLFKQCKLQFNSAVQKTSVTQETCIQINSSI